MATSGRAAIVVVCLAIVLSSAAIMLAAVGDHGSVGEKITVALLVGIPYPLVGGLLLTRVDGNALGWILVIIGLLQGINSFSDEYAYRAFVTAPGSLPWGPEASWFAFWSWMPSLALLVTLLLLFFPTGSPPSRRWRWAAWLGAAGITLIVVGAGWAAWPQRGSGLDVTGQESEVGGVGVALVVAGAAAVLVGALASVASLIVRYRRSIGVERLQIKWFTYAGAFAFLAIAVQFLPPLNEVESGLEAALWMALLSAGLLAIPVAIGIAVLKYRLYDIDRIISNSLVYGGVTAILILGYVGLVLGLQALLPLSKESPITVAVSTLAMAALFGPLRTRIQDVVDKRFYRARYNAAITVDGFTDRLRRQTDLDALTGDLLDVVSQTLQPLHASIWLRGSEERR